jgi:hypothetical protein
MWIWLHLQLLSKYCCFCVFHMRDISLRVTLCLLLKSLFRGRKIDISHDKSYDFSPELNFPILRWMSNPTIHSWVHAFYSERHVPFQHFLKTNQCASYLAYHLPLRSYFPYRPLHRKCRALARKFDRMAVVSQITEQRRRYCVACVKKCREEIRHEDYIR